MNRIDLINYLIKVNKYNRYLEIGCRDNSCFNNIEITTKIGVDPDKGGTLKMTSDDYFKKYNDNFDIIFIDGLHYSEQVIKDVLSSIKILNKDGIIILHDCNPKKEKEASYPYSGTNIWNGDVWKAYLHFREYDNLDMIMSDFDHGCGLIKIRQNQDKINLNKDYKDLTWFDYKENYHLLNIKDFQYIKKWEKSINKIHEKK
jgi:hypothetical protein